MNLYNHIMKHNYLLVTLLTSIMASSPLYSGTPMTGDSFSMFYQNQGGVTPSQDVENAKSNPAKTNDIVCNGGTCTARGAGGSTLTVKANSIADAQIKINAFQSVNGGKYQMTEWVSADGSIKWTPPPGTHALGNNAKH